MKTLIKILCLSVLWFSCESSTEPENIDDNNGCEGYFDECGICNGEGPSTICWESSIVCDIEDCPTYNTIIISDIWKQNTDLTPDQNGFYHFNYEPPDESDSDYGTVKYINELGNTRTFWESPDTFWVYHQNQWIGTPIIDNSTYSSEDGSGQQLFYVYPPFIGDTLSIFGYICDWSHFGDCENDFLVKDSVYVIIE